MERIRFDELEISQAILKALDDKGYIYATRIQKEAIPPLIQWEDVIAKAPTGTGKTFAFGIPIIQHIDPSNEQTQALILAPTRELAVQITDEIRGILKYSKNVRAVCLYGGQKIENQIRSLKKKPQIIVATPGRLFDHIKRKTVDLAQVQTLILDEADRMLDMGFIKEVTKIIELCKNRKNLGLFSATISQEVMTISWKYQRDEVEITVPAEAEDKPDITQYSIEVNSTEKIETVLKLLNTQGYERVMVFCNTKHMAAALYETLKNHTLTIDQLHGDIPQRKREETMDKFRKGNLNVLIATDVASRGIDVDDVECVINFDIPDENEYYVHRIGRTGRARRKGTAITIVSSILERAKLKEIASYCRFDITEMRIAQNGSLEKAPERKVIKRSTRRF